MKKCELNILFLGAAKRVSLLERFIDSAKKMNIEIKMFSAEMNDDFYPISHLATIITAPKFLSEEFNEWLLDAISANTINMIIPNMDSATVALSKFKKNHESSNCWCVVSSYDLCRQMHDKIDAEKFFINHAIPTINNTPGHFPKIVKNRTGYGSRDQFIIKDQREFDALMGKISVEDYLVQDYMNGQETTVDMYISLSNYLVGYVLRDRLLVSDGEVMNCLTRIPQNEEAELIEKVASITGFVGCITLQYIRCKSLLKVIEINPRFGGGSTCAIECGLDMPLYILSEYIYKENATFDVTFKKLKMVRARRDFFCEY